MEGCLASYGGSEVVAGAEPAEAGAWGGPVGVGGPDARGSVGSVREDEKEAAAAPYVAGHPRPGRLAGGCTLTYGHAEALCLQPSQASGKPDITRP